MTNIHKPYGKYPGVSIKTISENFLKDFGFLCRFMHCIQQPMNIVWLKTIDQRVLLGYHSQRNMEVQRNKIKIKIFSITAILH